MFVFDSVVDSIKTAEFTITGSTYEPAGDVLRDGAKGDCSTVSGQRESIHEEMNKGVDELMKEGRKKGRKE